MPYYNVLRIMSGMGGKTLELNININIKIQIIQIIFLYNFKNISIKIISYLYYGIHNYGSFDKFIDRKQNSNIVKILGKKYEDRILCYKFTDDICKHIKYIHYLKI